MESNLIGKNAGTIWNILHESNEKMEVARLKKESHLTDDEFWAAIGWHSRESKLVYATEKKGGKNIGYYALGE